MTNDKQFWCEFGCEVGIYYEHIEFSDGLKIHIPRSVKTDKIHNCPNLDVEYLSSGGNDSRFSPDDDANVWKEMADEQDGHFWNEVELGEHYLAIYENLQGIDGLEFKIYRHDAKAKLVEFLSNIPDFYNEITISGESEHLPACLQNTTVEVPGDYDQIGSFQPAALLGLFYEMDGSLEDAKKCFEIQTKISSDFKIEDRSVKDYWLHRVEEINQQISILKKIGIIDKQITEQSKKPQTSQQQDQTLLQDVLSKTHNFERDDLRGYALSKINSNDMKTILKEAPWYNHNDKKLIDKVRKMQAKEENDTILPLDPTDWDYLDLSDKIRILKLCPKCHKTDIRHTKEDLKMHKQNLIPNITKTISQNLRDIHRHRNAILAHPKRYKKKDLEQRNKIIMLYIQECIDFFERSKNA